MKDLKKNILSIYIKLIVLQIGVVLLMRFLVPLFANYPPDSEVHEFQKVVEILTHNMQYLVLGTLNVILYAIFITILLRPVFKYLKKDKKDITFSELQTVRNTCFKFPGRIVLVQLATIILVLLILFTSMTPDFHLVIKFLLIYLSFFVVAAIMANVLIRNELEAILISTYNIDPHYVPPKKTAKFSNELLYNILPFFAVVIISIALLGYSKTCRAIGEGDYYYYKYYLADLNLNNSTIDDIKEQLDTIPLKSESDYYFIHYNDENVFSRPDGNISNFFIAYADMFLEKTNGRVYEYYGIEEEAYVQKIKLKDGTDAYVGFKYSVTSNELISYFTTISIVAIIVYIIILILWSKNVSQNIKQVADKLTTIAEQKEVSKIGVLPVTSNDEIGQLTVAFNQIQQTSKKNIDTIKSNQSQLIEQERLASLGQMIGGIAHNLKTPIMSIAGITEALQNLTIELDNSIGNPVVTEQDFHDIAKDYFSWITKIREHTEYMSDIITAVKGQATNLSNDIQSNFTISELLKRVDILMKHELKNAIVYLNITVNMDENTVLNGDVNILVQVINNMISNAIQAYNGKPEQTIELNVSEENSNVIISIQDHASGLPKNIQNKLFKEMVTTKGKNGTGLGLYMSYSTIKGNFKGDITFETEEGKGTTFKIILPLN